MSRKDGKSDDLRNMLMSFRIAELQTLLGSCGRSRSGRKHELLGRALNLLKTSEGTALRDRVKSRILELYHQRFPIQGGNSSYPSNPQPYVSYTNDRDEEPTYLNRPSYSVQSSSSHRNVTYHGSHMGIPPTESRLQPVYDSSRSMQSATAGMPIHPDVRFIKLPFFNNIDVLIKPTSLVQKSLVGMQDMSLVYHLTPYQTQLITNSRSFNIKSVIEYGVQVQLRFCLAETSCVQEDLYPPKCKIFINGKLISLPGQPPPNAQNQEPRKPHRPINITPFCRLSPMQSNNIAIQWMPSDLGQRFAATVHLVQTVQTSTLIEKLRQRPERSPDHTLAFIKEKLRKDPDSEIALTSLKVSLCCPIGRTRMTMPCRANNCNHLQCFDGSLYIMLNERKPSWVCPVCDQKAHYDQLFIDGLFIQISKQSPNCDDIVFFDDGSWRPLSDIQDTKPLSQLVNTPRRNAEEQRVDVVECSSPPSASNSAAMASGNPVDASPPLAISERTTPVHTSDYQDGSVVGDHAAGQHVAADDEAEVIIIDDSDSEESNQTPDVDSRPPEALHRVPSTDGNTYPVDGGGSAPSFPFGDTELQGLDLYNLLPREDRIAAAMYLDQAGILSQLTNSNSRSSPSSVIDISDE